jgi:hypothetical protein
LSGTQRFICLHCSTSAWRMMHSSGPQVPETSRLPWCLELDLRRPEREVGEERSIARIGQHLTSAAACDNEHNLHEWNGTFEQNHS